MYSAFFIKIDNSWCKFCYYAYIGLLSVIHVVFFLIPLINHPIPIHNTKQKKKNVFIELFYALLFLIGGVSIYVLLRNVTDFTSYFLLRSCCLLYGFYFVAEKISENMQKTPLIDRIDDLIDQVTFENLDDSSALKKLKLIMIGLELQDAISPLISEFFELEKLIREKIFLLNEMILRLKDEKDEIKLKALRESIDLNFKQFQNIHHVNVKSIVRKISSRLSIYSRFENDNAAIELIKDSLNDTLNKIQLHIDSLAENVRKNVDLLS